MSALRRLRQTDSEINFKPWIFEIARNAAIDQYRRNVRTDEVSIDIEGGFAPSEVSRVVRPRGPDSSMLDKQRLDHLRGALDELSDTHHRIIVMRELEGLSYREIGEKMELTPAAVESTLFRARRKLEHEYSQLDTGRRCQLMGAVIGRLAEGLDSDRDRRRLDRHARRCSSCRRRSRQLGVEPMLPRHSIAARAAAVLPLPLFLRRRFGGQDPGLTAHAAAPVGAVSAPDARGRRRRGGQGRRGRGGRGAHRRRRRHASAAPARSTSAGKGDRVLEQQQQRQAGDEAPAKSARRRARRRSGPRRRRGAAKRERRSEGRRGTGRERPAETEAGRAGEAAARAAEPSGIERPAAAAASRAMRGQAPESGPLPVQEAAVRGLVSIELPQVEPASGRGALGHAGPGRAGLGRRRVHGRAGAGSEVASAPMAKASAADSFLESLMDTSLYSMGAYFSDEHPDLVDEVIAQSEAIERAGIRGYAEDHDLTAEACFETLLTGLAVRYYNAVAA